MKTTNYEQKRDCGVSNSFKRSPFAGFPGLGWPELERRGSVNIMESDANYELELLVPGFEREDIKISLEQNILVISGNIAFEKKEDVIYHRLESKGKTIDRKFELPKNIDKENILAKMDKGILYLTLPKKEGASEAIEIEIK